MNAAQHEKLIDDSSLPRHRIQVAHYAAAGAIATGAHYGLLAVLVMKLGFPVWQATAFGALGGAVTGYVANARWTFQRAIRSRDRFIKFLTVAGLLVAVNALAVGLLNSVYALPLWPAQMGVTAVLFVTSYAINQHWSFA